MKKQQENVAHLLKLIQENPDLKIMPMVDYEVVGGDDFSCWAGSWGEARIDEYWHEDERIYFRSKDEEELIDDVLYGLCENDDDDPPDLDIKATEIVKGYEWKKVIVVRIKTP